MELANRVQIRIKGDVDQGSFHALTKSKQNLFVSKFLKIVVFCLVRTQTGANEKKDYAQTAYKVGNSYIQKAVRFKSNKIHCERVIQTGVYFGGNHPCGGFSNSNAWHSEKDNLHCLR